MRASRSGARSGSARRSRTNACQSRIGVGGAHDGVDRLDVRLPRLALPREHTAAFRREAIEAALALAGFLDPSPFDPAAVLETEKRGIESRQREGEAAAGAGFDELADLVAMARAGFDERQHQHLGAALLQLRTEHRRLNLQLRMRRNM